MSINFNIYKSKQNIKKALTLGVFFTSIFMLPAYADKKIAVLPFNIPNEKQELKQFSYGTMAVINHTFNSMPEYTVIDRGQIDSILKELGFQNTGYTDEKTSVRIGKISGVDILVIGTIQTSNNNYRINLNITDVQTGKITKTFQVTGSEMFSLQDQLAGELLSLGASKEKIVTKNINPQAYSLYVRAEDLLPSPNIDVIKESIQLFDKAMAIENVYPNAIYGKIQAKSALSLLLKEEGKSYTDILSEVKKSLNEVPLTDKQNTEILFANYFISKIENNSLLEKELSAKLIKNSKNKYINVLSQISKIYSNNNKMDNAANTLNEALKLDPFNIFTLSELADLYSEYGQKEKAINLYENIIKINPHFIMATIDLAVIYLLDSNYEKAINIYNEALKLEPNEAILHHSLGTAYLLNGKYKEAISELEKTISLNEDFLDTYIMLGQLYSSQKKYNEALEYYSKALEIATKPGSKYNYLQYNVYKNFGNFYNLQKKYAEALNYYNKALQLKPEDPDIYSLIAENYLADNNYEKAIEEYKKAIGYIPPNNRPETKVRYYSSIGSIYIKQKKFSEALEYYNQSKNLNPADTDVIVNIAYINEKTGNINQAISEYIEGIKLNPDFIYFYTSLSDIYLEQKNYADALKYLALAKSKNPNDEDERAHINESLFQANMNLGINSHSSGKLDEAVTYYNQAIKIKPDASLYNNLGVIYYTKAKYQAALDQYKKALEIKSDYADVHNNLGIIYQALGYKAESESEYKKACDFGLKSSCK